ncbi:hypothetical protein [Candidatus Methylomirabilis sp.]|uniref:hypothetical protein n=1 Tax=Candidatus Methylomirabilis sp. TaxID=2032687 RepID=UPI002A5D2A7C|nr:hypothetical protein [Candidatus Methylomirabilis sp.]
MGVTRQRLFVAEQFFGRYGPWTVFLARFIGGLRFMAGPLSSIGWSTSSLWHTGF